MRKILFAIGSLQIGGAETVLVDVINNIYNEFDITVLLIEKRGELIDNLNRNVKIKYLTLSDNECSNFFMKKYNKIKRSLIYRYLCKNKKYIKRIYHKVLKEDYDVEVAFLAGAPSNIIKNSPNTKSKKIGWIHTTVTKDDTNTYKNYLSLTEGYDKIVAVSQASLDIFKNTFPNTSEKLLLIHNFVDTNKIISKSEEKAEIAFLESKKNIVSVGRVSEEKGYDRILKIAKAFENKVNFYIIGKGDLKEKFEQQIIDNEIKNIIFLGIKKNPYPYIKKADAFLLSSRQEAYPTVVIEAMILNSTIIATKVTGVEEILKDYTNKILIDNNDNSLENGIEKWLESNSKKQKRNNKFKNNNLENLNKIRELLK